MNKEEKLKYKNCTLQNIIDQITNNRDENCQTLGELVREFVEFPDIITEDFVKYEPDFSNIPIGERNLVLALLKCFCYEKGIKLPLWLKNYKIV